MKKNITVIKGDGIGPEIVTQAMRGLDKIAEKHGHEFCYTEILAGGCAIDAVGKPLPEESLQACLSADSVLLGAVGGPKWDAVDQAIRPEKALLGIRKAMGLYANMRPAKLFPQLSNASPLSDEVVARGIDMVVVRELIGGIYFDKKGVEEIDGEKSAYDVMRYSEHEIERIARTAFDTARKRNKKVTSIDKMNVLSSSRLWRDVVHRVAEEYPDVELVDMLVDNAAMQLVRDPSQFDVIVTENMFGDILSDEASMITGSIGMIPSSSLGETKNGMYEPIHGSAPDIAGKDLANPIGTILAAAMMLKYSFDMDKESEEIENAVASVLDAGYRTGDIMSPGKTQVGCQKMGDLIVAAL
ncbi:MAG: 3-isopropylmalate dehydrogenase [Christensenellales bacterium]